MIVNDLNLVRVTVVPTKADAPLIVHANTVLAGPIALEFLEPIAGRDAEIIQNLRCVYGDEFAEHGPQELSGKSTYRLALEEGFGVSIGEALDHDER